MPYIKYIKFYAKWVTDLIAKFKLQNFQKKQHKRTFV